MSNFLQNLPHLIMATVVIAAASVLAAIGTISGGEALGVIGAAGGLSLGVGAAAITPGGGPPHPPT